MFKGGLLPQKSRILRWHSLGTRYTFRMAGPVCRSVGLETTGYGNEEKKEHVITQGGGPIMQRQRFFFSTDLSRSGGGKEEICMGLNLEKGKTVERSGEERKGERFNCPWENGGWRKEGTSRVQFLYYYFKLPTFSTEHFRPQLKTHFDALNFHQMGDYVNNFRAKFILPFESENLLCTCVYIYICNRFSFSFFGEEEKKGRKEGRSR